MVETRQDVAALIEKYRELRENSGRPVRDDSNTHYMLKHLEDGLGDVAAASLDTDKILTWCQLRKKEGRAPTPSTWRSAPWAQCYDTSAACYGSGYRISSARLARACGTSG